MSGNVRGQDVIFDENDDNYQHVKIVKVNNQNVLKYSVEGVDFRNDKVTVILYAQTNDKFVDSYGVYKIPLSEKSFVGTLALKSPKSKKAHELKISCLLK